MNIFNTKSMRGIPSNYDFSNGLVFYKEDDGFKRLILPFDLPYGNSIAEQFINYIAKDNNYERIYIQSESQYGIECPTENEVLNALFPDCSQEVQYIRMHSEALWQILNADATISTMLYKKINNHT